MSKVMFEQLIEKPGPTKKWVLFPASLIIHCLVVAAVFLAPYLSADNELPRIVYIDMMLGSPPAPQPPVVGKAGKKRKEHQEKKKEKQEKPKPEIHDQRFAAPIRIPDDIEEENLEDLLGPGGGGDHNIIGAPEIEDIGNINLRQLLVNKDKDGSGNSAPETVVSTPRLMKKVPPQYPTVARRAHISGVVEVRAVTDVYGRVVKASVVRGHPLLTGAAIQAVKQWVYEPYIINGNPKPVTFIARVVFTLQK